MRSLWLPVVAAFSVLFGATGARSSAPDDPPLTLSGAVERALTRRPELTGFPFTLRIQQARRSEAALRPRPQVELLVEDALGTGLRSGVNAAQTTLVLSQVLELRGKRTGREAVVEAGGDLVRVEHDARQLDIVAEVARRFFAVLEGQLRLDLATEAVRIAGEAQSRVEARVKASRSPPAEAARAGVHYWDVKLLAEDAEHELEIARHFLAAAMGEEQVRFGRADGDLMVLPEVVPFEVLAARVAETPELLRFASEERLRDAEIRLAELQRRSDPLLTLGARRYEQGSDVALIAGITVPLFAPRAAQPVIDRARAQRDLAGSARDARRLQLQAQLFSEFTQLQHEAGLSATLRDELLPRLEQALQQAAYAYERGRFNHLEWTTAQRELLQGRLRLLESAGRFHVLRVEIERLTGTSLPAKGEDE